MLGGGGLRGGQLLTVHDKGKTSPCRVLPIWIHWPRFNPSVDPEPIPDLDLEFL